MQPADKPVTRTPAPLRPAQSQQSQPQKKSPQQQGDALFWSWAAPTPEQQPKG